ncbi:hypothetical protein [Streptomyces atratus]
MIDTLGSAAGESAFVGPDQAALEQMLAEFEPTGGEPQPVPGSPE